MRKCICQCSLPSNTRLLFTNRRCFDFLLRLLSRVPFYFFFLLSQTHSKTISCKYLWFHGWRRFGKYSSLLRLLWRTQLLFLVSTGDVSESFGSPLSSSIFLIESVTEISTLSGHIVTCCQFVASDHYFASLIWVWRILSTLEVISLPAQCA